MDALIYAHKFLTGAPRSYTLTLLILFEVNVKV